MIVQKYLVNDAAATPPPNLYFTLADKPHYFFLGGASTDTFTLQIRSDDLTDIAVYSDVYFDSVPVQLSALNNEVIVKLPGQYRWVRNASANTVKLVEVYSTSNNENISPLQYQEYEHSSESDTVADLIVTGSISGAGFVNSTTALFTSLLNASLAAPPVIGNVTPNNGNFVALNASVLNVATNASILGNLLVNGLALVIGDVNGDSFNVLNSTDTNTRYGFEAIRDVTIGIQNTGIGYRALAKSLSYYGTAVGYNAFANAVNGLALTGVGSEAGANVVNGDRLVFVGTNAGQNVVDSNDHIAIGNGAGPTTDTLNKTICIGNNVQSTASLTTTIGDEDMVEARLRGMVKSNAGVNVDQVILSGVIYRNFTAVGNAGAGLSDLMAYTLPENSFKTDGNGVRVTCWGTHTSNPNAKTYSVNFGAFPVFVFAIPINTAGRWRLELLIFRTASNTQSVDATYISASSTVVISQARNGTVTLADDTLPIIIQNRVNAVATNDFDQQGMLIEFFN